MKKLLSLLLFLLLVCLMPATLAEDELIPPSPSTLDVISITIDPDALWNEKTGIFVEGNRIIKQYGIPYQYAQYRNFVNVQHPAVMTYLPVSGEAYTEDVLMKLHDGILDLDAAQKSLELTAADGMFEQPLFPDSDCAGLPKIVLSNGGSECIFTRFANGYQVEMINALLNADILLPMTRPVAVYINGEYWGHYNLTEPLDPYAVCRYTGFDPARTGEVTIINSSGRAVYGSKAAYDELTAALNPAAESITAEMQQYIEAHVDINSCLDWLAVTMYLGDAIPSSVQYYRLPNGLWRCAHVSYHMGLLSTATNTPANFLREKGFLIQGDNLLFRRILEIDEYRTLFLEKLGAVYQTLTAEAMQNALDEYAALLRPEMTAHYERWAATHEPWLNTQWPTEPAAALAYWEARIQRMRDLTIVKRPYYVYTYTQEAFGLTDAEMAQYFGSPAPERPADTVWTPPGN